MSKITIPEDSPQVLKDLVARAEKAEGEQEKQKIVSARDRLMQYLNNQTEKVMLSDDEDDFIEIRLLTPKEQTFLTDLSVEMTNIQREIDDVRREPVKTKKAITKKNKNLQTLIDKTNKLLEQQVIFLSAICVDSELNYEFWTDGDAYPAFLPTLLLGEALRRSYSSTRERIAQARFFRDNRTR
jgi:hypothetical protein